MLKAILTSIVVPGIALLIAIPAPSFAESDPRAGSHVKRHSAYRSKHYKRVPSKHHRRHTRHVQHYRHDPGHSKHVHRRHRRHDRRHHRRHDRRHGVHIGIHIGGIAIGGYPHRPSYPHGHAYHIHNDYCPVVIRPVVVAPTWEVYYHAHHHHPTTAILHVLVGPFSGALYVDGHYYGDTHNLHDGRLELPVTPGLHTVQLRHGGRTYTHKVRAKPGATAVVKANRI